MQNSALMSARVCRLAVITLVLGTSASIGQQGTFEAIGTLQGDGRSVVAIDVSADGKYLLIADDGGNIRLWFAEQLAQFGSVRENSGNLSWAKYTRSGDYFLSYNGSFLRIWSTALLQPITSWPMSGKLVTVEIDPAENDVYVAYRDGFVARFSLGKDGKRRYAKSRATSSIPRSLYYNPVREELTVLASNDSAYFLDPITLNQTGVEYLPTLRNVSSDLRHSWVGDDEGAIMLMDHGVGDTLFLSPAVSKSDFYISAEFGREQLACLSGSGGFDIARIDIRDISDGSLEGTIDLPWVYNAAGKNNYGLYNDELLVAISPTNTLLFWRKSKESPSSTEVSERPSLEVEIHTPEEGDVIRLIDGDSRSVPIRIKNTGSAQPKALFPMVSKSRITDNLSIQYPAEVQGLSTQEETEFQVNLSVGEVDFPVYLKATLSLRDDKGAVSRDNLVIDIGLSPFISEVDTIDIMRMAEHKNSFAVILGVEEYSLAPPANYAKRDAQAFALHASRVLGVPDDGIHKYLGINAEVTLATFQKLFGNDGWLSRRTDDSSVVYIFFAGHGTPNIKTEKGYLLPYDGDPLYLSQTGYSLDEFFQDCADLKGKSINVFLDACFSGIGRENTPLFAESRPMHISIEQPKYFSDRIAIFSAARGTQTSNSYPSVRHGMFTYFLLKGIRGEGDDNSDGSISVEELEKYLLRNVSKTSLLLSQEQEPQVISKNKSRALVRQN